MLGTPAYMPPEQATGRLAELDERSDVYSLGAILYEILTRRPPHRGDTSFEVLAAVVGRPVRPPSEIAEVPEELEAICLRALSKKKEDRPQRAADLQADVEAWLEGTRERERREQLAAGQVARARESAARWRRKALEAREAAARAPQLEAAFRPRHAEARKREVWAAEDRAEALERESTAALADTEAALAAGDVERPRPPRGEDPQGGARLGTLPAGRTCRGPPGHTARLAVAREYNDGILDARLAGTARAGGRDAQWPCDCLAAGRESARTNSTCAGTTPGRASPETGTPEGLRSSSRPALSASGPRARLPARAARGARSGPSATKKSTTGSSP